MRIQFRVALKILLFIGVFALLFIIESATGGQEARPSSPQSEKCRLEGQVLNSATGKPLRKVYLALLKVSGNRAVANRSADETAPTAVTDAGGRFAFSDVEPGTYRLWAQHTGFRSQNYGVKGRYGMGDPIQLSPGDFRRDIKMPLTPLAAVIGRILDEDGDPIEHVDVSLMIYQYTPNGRRLTPIIGGSTNDLGEYRISNVEPGRYYLQAKPFSAQGFGAAWPSLANDSLAAAYYPSSHDLGTAKPIDLSAGQQLRDVNMTLPKGHLATVRGAAIKPAGSTSVSTNVIIPGFQGNAGQGMGMADPNGNFVIRGLLPGPYVLTATSMVGDKRYSVRRLIEVGSADIEGIELRPLPPRDIKGQIRVEGAADGRLPHYVRLHSLIADSNDQAPGRVQEDGTFELKNVAPDLYRVSLMNLQGLYVKAIRLADTDITESGLDLTGTVPGDLSIVLGANGGHIEGSVLDERAEPAASAMVTLVSAAASSNPRRAAYQFKMAMTDDKGRFLIDGIAPGSYKLFAWDTVDEGGVLYDPGYLKPFEEVGRTVQVSENSKEAVQLKLIKNLVER